MSAASWKSSFPFAVVVFLTAAQRVDAQDEIELLKRQLSAMQTMVQKMAERVEKLERERASLDRTLESLHRDFAREIIPIQLPLGEERAFTGVIDLVRMKALTFAGDDSGKTTDGAVPDALKEAAQAARDALIEMVAEADDALMEKFFEAGTLTQDELTAGLTRAVRAGKLFPVFCASGLRRPVLPVA